MEIKWERIKTTSTLTKNCQIVTINVSDILETIVTSTQLLLLEHH